MVEVQGVTFSPSPDRRIETTMQIGEQVITSSWPVDETSHLMRLLEPLVIRIEQISFVKTAEGHEIHADMRIADRQFVSAWVIEEDDDLQGDFRALLQGAGRAFLEQVQSALRTREIETVRQEAEVPSSTGW